MKERILWFFVGLLSGAVISGLGYKEIYFWHLHLLQTQQSVNMLNEQRVIQCKTVYDDRTLQPVVECTMSINGDPGT